MATCCCSTRCRGLQLLWGQLWCKACHTFLLAPFAPNDVLIANCKRDVSSADGQCYVNLRPLCNAVQPCQP